MKKIAVLGSTGSIGRQALDVLSQMGEQYQIVALTANTNAVLLSLQQKKTGAEYAGLVSSGGKDCLVKALADADVALIATGGIDSLDAVIYCLKNGKDILIANKEVIVCAGELIYKMLSSSQSKLYPLDSEHSAIWQCLDGKRADKLILTASGGAFYDKTFEELKRVDIKTAFTHPRWDMGKSITLDSNTMFNKTLEVLEARWLFNMPLEDIEITVHRQSIVHSLVRFKDGCLLAQLSNPDMRLPISYALGYPSRVKNDYPPFDIAGNVKLTFEKVDGVRFPCVNLCYDQRCNSGLMPTVMVAANEALRVLFERGKVAFCDFYETILYVVEAFYPQLKDTRVTREGCFNTFETAKKYTFNLFGENI